jgi:hypothetical protein
MSTLQQRRQQSNVTSRTLADIYSRHSNTGPGYSHAYIAGC